MSSNLQLVSLEDVKAAHDIIRPNIHQTPVISSASITKLTSHQSVVFKCENLQRTGSFKVRGAMHAVARAQLSNPHIRDFVTHSSGNHGQASRCCPCGASRRVLSLHLQAWLGSKGTAYETYTAVHPQLAENVTPIARYQAAQNPAGEG